MANTSPRRPIVAACCKLVARRVDVDPLTGAARPDPHSVGMSAADEAALEWAMRIAAACGGTVRAVCAGPLEADAMLREALAAGAAEAVRVALAPGQSSAVTAAALAGVLKGASVVCCGDASLDRGTGSVPAYLADELGAAQALGLVGLHVHVHELEPDGVGPLHLRAERRLDRGRREHLALAPPCVVSVEAATARLRRAPLSGLLVARDAPITVAVPLGEPIAEGEQPLTAAYRPRTRVVPPPSPSLSARERVLALTGMLAERAPARTLRVEPDEAAEVLLEALAAWGEL